MIDFRSCANLRVKQYLRHNSSTQNKKAIKAFFTVLRTQGLSKARIAALIKGSKHINYLIDSLSQDYIRSKK